MSRIEISREIHPIGQGAFYSEIISKDDQQMFCMVYDCGSYADGHSMRKKAPPVLINHIDVFKRSCNGHINALIISHFHLDHINGIKKLLEVCKVDRIYLPKLNDDERLYYFLSNCMVVEGDNNEFDTAENDWYLNFYFGRNENKIEISVEEEPRIEVSLETDWAGNWTYIPVLFKESRKNSFISRFITGVKQLIGDDYIQLEQETLKQRLVYNWNRIKTLYTLHIVDHNTITRTREPNENNMSLMVYSGGELIDGHAKQVRHLDIDYDYSHDYECYDEYHHLHLYRHNNGTGTHFNFKNGCLYTGDMLKKKAFEYLSKKLGDKLNNIDIIQISHHGSYNAFNNHLLSIPARYSFCCFGSASMYNHPNNDLITKYENDKTIVFKIDEKRSGDFTSRIDIYY